MLPTSIGTPRLRSSSLSRSNIFSNASVEEPGYRISRIRFFATYGRWTTSMINRFRSRSDFLAPVLMPPILPDRSGCGQDVDHEVQRVGALDARLGVAGRAVPLGRRDREDHPAADGRADQRLVPAGDDLADTDAERRRLPAVALVEGLGGLVDLAEVVDGDRLARLHDVAVALDQ